MHLYFMLLMNEVDLKCAKKTVNICIGVLAKFHVYGCNL